MPPRSRARSRRPMTSARNHPTPATPHRHHTANGESVTRTAASSPVLSFTRRGCTHVPRWTYGPAASHAGIGACTLSLPRLPMAASCAALGEEVRKEVAMCLYISLRSKVCWEFGHGAWLRPWRIARRGKRTGCYVICSTRKS